jgi:hypothetical protein
MTVLSICRAHHRIGLLVLVVVAVGYLTVANEVQAAARTTKSNADDDARRLVQEALHREIYGQSDERRKLLDEAADLDPHYAPVQWHRGVVRYANQWMDADAVPAMAARDRRLVAYALRRAEAPKTVAGQLALAGWCRKQDLYAQERAHLAQVLEINPNHADARERLGFRRLQGRWITEQQIQEINRQQQVQLQALTAWRPRIVKLRNDLLTGDQRERQLAESLIRTISDPEAIPALEGVLSNQSEAAARMVLDALANMTHQQAALSLSRHAVMSPWEDIRLEAARALSDRPYDHFVPTLLSSMFTPVSSHVMIGQGPRGTLMYRHSFVREAQDQNQLLVLDTVYQRISQPGGNAAETASRTMANAAREALMREVGVARQNQASSQMNSRIAQALSLATGQQPGSAPQDWWNWWHQQNEVYVGSQKSTQLIRQSRQIAMVDRSGGRQTGGGGGGTGGGGGGSMDCLAAGTLIWTLSGPRPIESIQAGDMVLSQHPDTGELAYQAVLGTTVRPSGPLVEVQVGSERFRTSGGHLFWVAGDGWVKARQLKSGAPLHGQRGTVPVRAVDTGNEAETYNLIVEGFHTYFVGEGKLLSHDNTVRRPTQCTVPGLGN